MERFISRSEAETEEIGRRFGQKLKAGDCAVLTGELGAGKTAFTRGIAAACGCMARPTSPTFTILNLYKGAPDVAHFDLYRLKPEELYDTGFFDYAGGNCVTVIEWGELARDLFCFPYYQVTIEYCGEGRAITIKDPE